MKVTVLVHVAFWFLCSSYLKAEEGVTSYPVLWHRIAMEAKENKEIVAYATADVIDVKDQSNPKVKMTDGTTRKLLVDVSNVKKRWTTKIEPEAQRFAMREAKLMAKRGRAAHFLGVAPGGNVAGVGSWHIPRCLTCEGDPGMVLIADAVAYSPWTLRWYRHRTWKYRRRY